MDSMHGPAYLTPRANGGSLRIPLVFTLQKSILPPHPVSLASEHATFFVPRCPVTFALSLSFQDSVDGERRPLG